MALDEAFLEAVYTAQIESAQNLLTGAMDELTTAYATFQDSGTFAYTPYEWQTPSPPIINYNPQFANPGVPVRGSLPKVPTLIAFPKGLDNPSFGKAPEFTKTAPEIDFPSTPQNDPGTFNAATPQIVTPVFPGGPLLLTLPSTALPYPFVTIPNAPTILFPAFDGVVPDDIHQISLQEYLDKLTSTYTQYSEEIPDNVRANWMVWFNALLDQRPLINKLATTISNYIDNGGSGVPEPIEEAIVTRATDRVASEQRRATLNVYDAAVKRGLSLPSGAMLSGLKEARQIAAEAVSKVATDVAIENLKLEHDHMKFMLQLGSELERWVAGFASDTAKVVLEANAQAIELTKLVLNGMIEINNTIVRIYLAKWEGYKAAVEVYRAKIAAIEEQVRVYEAEIKAELAKTEVNKATVEILNAIVNANRAIAEVFKVQVDAETAKVEASRVAVMAYEAQVRAYGARVEAWRAQWQGYTAQVEGQTAKARVFESEANAYTATVNGYKANIEGYSALVRNQAVQIDAVAKQNDANLRVQQVELEGVLRAYVADLEAYGKHWQAIAEQLRGYAVGSQIVGDFVSKMYTNQIQIDTERAREHLSEWNSQVQVTLQAAAGLNAVAKNTAELTSSALNGITTFAGALATVGA